MTHATICLICGKVIGGGCTCAGKLPKHYRVYLLKIPSCSRNNFLHHMHFLDQEYIPMCSIKDDY